ncbi:MAG: NAD(P)/FAD-dependent oxidoreductase [Actinomycetota bacterium]
MPGTGATIEADPIEADYVVIGAGAMGMAFTDVILTHTDATVAIVDRHDKPGGHWNDAYPFVRLHQPSAFYGVDSAELGSNRIDEIGGNAGLSELASGAEVCAYFDQVMQRRFLPSGRVVHHPRSVYADGVVTSMPTGRSTSVRVGRRLVDATYMNVTVPSMRPPSYAVADGVRVIPPNGLPSADHPDGGYVIVGAGKTAIDAVLWLLDRGVDPADITWITPRDSWLLNRAVIQPGDGFRFNEQFEVLAAADSAEAVYLGMEEAGHFLRIDPSVEPTMYRCATVTEAELTQLRRVSDGIVRQGRVERVEPEALVLESGTLSRPPGTLYVDCSADGLARRPAVPVFADDRLTLQTVRACQQVFSAALIARVEADRSLDLDAANALTGVIPHPDVPRDFLSGALAHIANGQQWLGHDGLLSWLVETRLSPDGPAADPTAVVRAAANLQRFLAE